MNIFKDLAQAVEQAWHKKQNDLTAFTSIATTALEDFSYNWPLEKLNDELRLWLLNNSTLPQQMSLHNTFGQPSITLYNNDRFVVDLYFWVDFDTSIHSHGFRGAFRVLHGESLQETFQIKILENIADDIRRVDLSQVQLKRLKKDDVQTIAPGVDLTHRVIHLANPTITLCVKTINEPELKQCNYLSSGLAIQKQTLTDELVKKIYFYQYILSHNKLQADEFLHTVLRSLNISTQILVYETVASRALDLSDETVDLITESFVKLHENSIWWAAYEKAHLTAMNEIQFKQMQTPLERLVAHFANCGYDLAQLQKIDTASMSDINKILSELK